MPAYWLTFRPHGPKAPQGWPIQQLRDLVRRFEADPSTATVWWRLVSHNAAHVGDRVYLFKQGDGLRGIFGVGKIIGGPEFRAIPTDPIPTHRALIGFEKLVEPPKRFLLRLSEIQDILPREYVNARSSGQELPVEVAVEIERMLNRS